MSPYIRLNSLAPMAIAIQIAFFASSSASADGANTVTFSGKVVRILQKHCQECHRPGGAAPMSYMTFEETRPWAKSIQKEVAARRMPPWYLDPKVGTWQNDRRLSAEEVETILRWVEQGTPEGDPKDLPEPRSFPVDWQRGEPDVVFELPEALVFPAGEASGTLDVLVPTGFTEDRWIKGVEVRPEHPELIHHVLVYATQYDALAALSANPKEPVEFLSTFITAYAPDRGYFDINRGEGVLVPAGTVLLVQVNYVKDPKIEALEMTRVGMRFADYIVRKRKYVGMVGTTDILIQAGDPHYERSATLRMDDTITIDNVAPHMHYRGISMKFSAQFPGSADPAVLMNASYDYNWNVVYVPEQPFHIPAGTTFHAEAVFDNSSNNPINPDPTVDVPFGLGSYSEMMYTIYSYTKDNEILHARDPVFGPLARGAN